MFPQTEQTDWTTSCAATTANKDNNYNNTGAVGGGGGCSQSSAVQCVVVRTVDKDHNWFQQQCNGNFVILYSPAKMENW